MTPSFPRHGREASATYVCVMLLASTCKVIRWTSTLILSTGRQPRLIISWYAWTGICYIGHHFLACTMPACAGVRTLLRIIASLDTLRPIAGTNSAGRMDAIERRHSEHLHPGRLNRVFNWGVPDICPAFFYTLYIGTPQRKSPNIFFNRKSNIDSNIRK